ncbi:hypothetical protein OROHE_010259 [Orobanche hederae]
MSKSEKVDTGDGISHDETFSLSLLTGMLVAVRKLKKPSKENGTQNNVDCINGIAYSEESDPSLGVLAGR